jgi:hypothetical protein
MLMQEHTLAGVIIVRAIKEGFLCRADTGTRTDGTLPSTVALCAGHPPGGWLHSEGPPQAEEGGPPPRLQPLAQPRAVQLAPPPDHVAERPLEQDRDVTASGVSSAAVSSHGS